MQRTEPEEAKTIVTDLRRARHRRDAKDIDGRRDEQDRLVRKAVGQRPPAFERQCVGQLARDRQPHDDGHFITQLDYELDGEEGRRDSYREFTGAEKKDQPSKITTKKGPRREK